MTLDPLYALLGEFGVGDGMVSDHFPVWVDIQR